MRHSEAVGGVRAQELTHLVLDRHLPFAVVYDSADTDGWMYITHKSLPFVHNRWLLSLLAFSTHLL